MDTVRSIQRLSGVIQQLPTEEMYFGLREFRDATVTKPTTGDTFRHVLRFEERFYGANHVRILLNTVGPGTPEERQRRAEEFRASDRRVESITTADALDQAIANPETRELVRGGIESDRIEAYRYEGTIPYMLAVTDGTAIVAPVDDYGIPTATIETENETILGWVHDKLDEYRAQSTELTLDDLPE